MNIQKIQQGKTASITGHQQSNTTGVYYRNNAESFLSGFKGVISVADEMEIVVKREFEKIKNK